MAWIALRVGLVNLCRGACKLQLLLQELVMLVAGFPLPLLPLHTAHPTLRRSRRHLLLFLGPVGVSMGFQLLKRS